MKKSSKQKKKKKRIRGSTRSNIKSALRLLPLAAPLILTAFIYMWQHTRTYIVGGPVEQLRAKKEDLKKENDSIRLRIEQLQAPGRIESIARGKLGMIAPQEYQLITLDAPMRPPGLGSRNEAAPDTNRQMARKPEKPPGILRFGFLNRQGELEKAVDNGSPVGADRNSG